MRKRRNSQSKQKAVAYELIPIESEIGRPIYTLLASLIEQHHRELRDARIALAWHTAWKADADGRLTLGKCRKASDLDRELAAFDFVILLNRDFYQSTVVTTDQRMALLDHELCHAAVAEDDDGEPKEDERGRIVYRTRKHDIEEFSSIVERYGTWKRDLEHFARAIRRAEQNLHGMFVGYTTLRDQLAAAGAAVPVETIVGWTDRQRSDAAIWAYIQRESPLMAPPLPAFIESAITPADASPVEDSISAQQTTA